MSENRSTRPHGPMGGPGRREKYQGDLKKSWGNILGFDRSIRPALIVSLAAAAAGTILTLLGPDKLSDLVNIISGGILGGVDLSAVASVGFTLIAMYAASFFLSSLQHYLMAGVTQTMAKGLRSAITQKISRLPMGYFNKVSTGDVLSRVTNDVDTIGQSFSQSLATLVSAVTMLVGCLFMMLKTNVMMTLAAIVSTIISFFLIMLIMGRSQRYFTKQQQALGAINGHVEEMYSGHMIVDVYNGKKDSAEAFMKLNEELRDSAFKAQGLAGLMQPLMSFIGNFGYVAVCVTGAVLAMKGSVSMGTIVAFMMYVRYFTQPMTQIAQAAQSLQSAAAAGDRVFEFLSAEEMEAEEETPISLNTERGEVVFDHVSFGYDPDKTIIHDFSASAKPGQKIAIVGPTGAGKTTLINLLMRFYETNGGTIFIDGIPSMQLTREQVHDQFCMVLQETWLFSGTVRENLVFGQENVSEEKIERALKAVGLDHFIETLPHGLDTILDDSESLSQGQRQQLTIARAMLTDRPMLILDEATSSVDTRTEVRIQAAMDALMKDRTSFVIAHRLSTIRNADLILVLKDGDVVESGTHEELLERNGFYADLYNSQFEEAS